MAAALRMGDPLYISGKIEVRLKNIGDADPETGVFQTAKFPFVRAAQLSGAQPGVHMKIDTPDWAAELQQEAESQHVTRQTRNAREAMADGADEATVVTELAPSSSLEPDAPAIDPGVLSALRGAPQLNAANPSR